MKSNLFKKYFWVSCLCVTFILIVLVFIEYFTQSDYIKKEKLSLLETNVISISESTRNMTYEYDYSAALKRSGDVYLSDEYTVFFVSLFGDILSCTDDNDGDFKCLHRLREIDQSIIDYVYENDIYSEYDNFGGMYSEKHFTAGAQLLDANNEIVGAVFISLDSDSYLNLMQNLLTTLVVTVVILLSVFYILMSIYTKGFLKPLEQMSDAAKSVANGDFTVKVLYDGDDEVGELARSFNNMCSSMRELEYARSSFIANVSHEFKTPMTVIGGYIDGILDGTIEKKDQNRYLSVVSNEVKRLNVMVNSMLQLSKLESGKNQLKFTNCDLSEIVLNVFLSFEKRIVNKNIDVYGLDSLGTISVECDPDLVYNAIYNLVDNAVKFTPEQGYISVAKAETVNDVKLFFKNSGSGISSYELIHIFERFYKTDKSRSADKSGTGLGLYIVKSVAHYHNGEALARSKFGAYTEFEISLPKKQS